MALRSALGCRLFYTTSVYTSPKDIAGWKIRLVHSMARLARRRDVVARRVHRTLHNDSRSHEAHMKHLGEVDLWAL